jgi:hypothetical protein
MIGTELINKIKELGEDKEIIVHADGACEGIFCTMNRKIYLVNSESNKIIINIDVDEI